jgi:hypothetical protein
MPNGKPNVNYPKEMDETHKPHPRNIQKNKRPP